MGVSVVRVLRHGALLAVFLPVLSAAPVLRLVTSAVGPVSISTGSAGPEQTVEAYNAGDGNLQLQVSASAPWINAAVGAARPCSSQSGNCLPIRINLPTGSLSKGIYTGVVTVSDPNAVDAPQTITVTVQIGGGVPDKVDLYVPPDGSSDEVRFWTNTEVFGQYTTQAGGSWLAFSLEGSGTFRFPLPYLIRGRHLPGMAVGAYNGSVKISNSSVPEDNKTVPVTLRVTTQPIARLSTERLKLRARQNFKKALGYLTIVNRGQGTLSVTSVTPSTSSGGNWLSVNSLGGGTYEIAADPTGLAVGAYAGTLAVASNAVNNPLSVSVELEVIAQAQPQAFFGGAVNIADFQSGAPVGKGDIVALFGEQLTYEDPVASPQVPLATQLGKSSVYVNDQLAPLYFTSYGQINFQLPYETPAGRAVVRVDRDGVRGNSISVDVADRASRILPRGIGTYGIVLVSDYVTYAMPSALAAQHGLAGRPARKGEYIVMYGVGMGPTSPPVASGVAAPGAEPLGRVSPAPKVVFGGLGPFDAAATVDPAYIGLTPTLVGLYQVNVQVPFDAPSGDSIAVRLEINKQPVSNQVTLAIE